MLAELVPPARLAQARRSLRVRIGQVTGQGFEAEVRIHGEAGEIARVLSGASCEGVAEAALLVIAVALDPEGLVGHEGLPSPAPEVDHAEARKARARRASLGLGVLGDFGSLPAPSVGLGLHAGLGWSVWQVAIELTGFWPRETREDAATAQGRMGLFSGALRSCVDLLREPVRLGPCAAVELGAATGRGTHVREGTTAVGLWALGLGGVALGLPVREGRAFSPQLLAALGVPWARPSFEVDGYGRVFRAAPWVARISIVVQRDFW